MSNSSLVDKTILTTHRDKGRGGNKIEKIVVHHMAGIMSIEQCGSVFKNREASAHYGIGTDGRIGQYVDEADTAWACGSRYWNQRTISIECANDRGASGNWHVNDKTIAACIKLVADICKRNNIKEVKFTGSTSGNLIMHRYVASTACPGAYLATKFNYIATEVNKLLKGSKKVSYKEIYKYKALRDINVYKDHAVKSGKIGTAKKGSIYSATRLYEDDWAYVPYLKGWIPLKGSMGTYVSKIEKLEYVVTNSSGINIYPDLAHKGKLIANVIQGAKLTGTRWYGSQVYFPQFKGWGAVSCLTQGTRGDVLCTQLASIAKTLRANRVVYSTSNVKYTLEAVLKTNKRIDCAHYVSFAMQAMGMMPRGKYIWLNTRINGNGASYITSHSNLFTIYRPNCLPKDFKLQKGDICGWGYRINGREGQHTQVFAGYDSAGHPLWYSAGTSDVKAQSYGPKRKTYENMKMNLVIRMK